MMITNRFLSRGRLPLIAAIAVVLSSCTVQEQGAPAITGPSELGLGMSLAANPEFLPRDGSSMSTITAKTYDSNGKPLAGQRIRVVATAGLLSANEVTTGSDGSVQFTLIAPGVNENVSIVSVSATPIQGTHLENANPRFVDILVSGPAIPIASFNFTPAAPAQFQLVNFDASTSFLGGAACGNVCSYAWDFGDGSTGTGRFPTHVFQNQGVHLVTLTVTAPSGTFRSVSRVVNVAAAVLPTADFTFSPGNPIIFDQIFFDGARSKGANGAVIVSWEWNFGNGTYGTGVTPPPVVYTVDRMFNVTLTVTDDRGQVGSVTKPVLISAP